MPLSMFLIFTAFHSGQLKAFSTCLMYILKTKVLVYYFKRLKNNHPHFPYHTSYTAKTLSHKTNHNVPLCPMRN